MRYFFHILDGPKVFPDEVGSRLANPTLAITQARALATELSKAGALCRSHLVFVLDENGNRIFGYRPADRQSQGGPFLVRMALP
ncbi:hypothetical protein SAMN03159423_5105 [Bradyrhizobium sp. NFR13]|jgi:hypothetical protein|uniref:DUF6894 family protein n=1 Tax=Bradyrhizobium sp. NFR13 TaxID=1566285 RepID=UPI0008E6B362|nr:hypothetical protein [Bradyrhizobium sp. NFR13]SFM05359.1 hypothetical protein SAMN03159423_5105 [Bradyrhizobium sp. NFR13]